MPSDPTHVIQEHIAQNSPGGPRATDHEQSEADYSEPLTGREEEVLELLVQGVTTTHELAASLVVSDNTVKYHLRNILDKLHLHNRAEVVAHASRQQRLNLVDGLYFASLQPRRRSGAT